MGLHFLNAMMDKNSNIPWLGAGCGEISTCIPSSAACDICKRETGKSKHASEMLQNQ